MKWKLLGLAGIIGAVAVGAVALNHRRHRAWEEYPPDELRSRLRARLAAAS